MGKWEGPNGCLHVMGNIESLPLPGFEPQTAQPVA
jgi:hypothetical protein